MQTGTNALKIAAAPAKQSSSPCASVLALTWRLSGGALTTATRSGRARWQRQNKCCLFYFSCLPLPGSLPPYSLRLLLPFCQCILASPAGVWQLNVSLGNEALFRNHYKARKSCPMSLAKTHGEALGLLVCRVCVCVRACAAYLRHQSLRAHPWLFASMLILPDALPRSCEISSCDSLLFLCVFSGVVVLF